MGGVILVSSEPLYTWRIFNHNSPLLATQRLKDIFCDNPSKLYLVFRSASPSPREKMVDIKINLVLYESHQFCTHGCVISIMLGNSVRSTDTSEHKCSIIQHRPPKNRVAEFQGAFTDIKWSKIKKF